MKRLITAGLLAVVAFVTIPTAAAEAKTAPITAPFISTWVPVYDLTGRAETMPAVQRWQGAGIHLWRVWADPGNGITIKWGEHLRGSNLGGQAQSSTWWNGQRWVTYACTIWINPNVRGNGVPSGKWLSAIVTHESGHCLTGGGGHDTSSTSIMRSTFSKAALIRGRGWLPTAADLGWMRAAVVAR